MAIFGFMATALIGALVYGRASTATGGDRVRALQLADEGVEAVHNIRDAGFTNLVDGTYGLAQSAGQWVLSGSSDTSGIYTRTIVISSNGTSRKNVVSTVSWSQNNSTSQVVQTTQFANWTKTKSWATPGLYGSVDLAGANDALKVATQGNYAYLVRNDGTPDFVILDISNPSAPTQVGSLSLTGAPTNIAVNGNYAYVSTTNTAGELAIINIATPSAPVLAGTYDAPGTAVGQGVAVVGNTAYLSRAANGGLNEFVVVSVANPASPFYLGGYGSGVSMREIYMSGNTAFVVTDTGRLFELSVAIPALIGLSLNYNLAGTGTAVTIDGSGIYLYIGRGTSLLVYNMATLLAPALLSNTTVSGTVNDVAIDSTATNLFLGTNNTTAEFQAYTVTNPAAPVLLSTFDIPGTTSNLTGVSYSTAQNVVVGASASDTQEAPIFGPN